MFTSLLVMLTYCLIWHFIDILLQALFICLALAGKKKQTVVQCPPFECTSSRGVIAPLSYYMLRGFVVMARMGAKSLEPMALAG